MHSQASHPYFYLSQLGTLIQVLQTGLWRGEGEIKCKAANKFSLI